MGRDAFAGPGRGQAESFDIREVATSRSARELRSPHQLQLPHAGGLLRGLGLLVVA